MLFNQNRFIRVFFVLFLTFLLPHTFFASSAAQDTSHTFKKGDIAYINLLKGDQWRELYDNLDNPKQVEIGGYLQLGGWVRILDKPQFLDGIPWWPVDSGGYQGWVPEISLRKHPYFEIGDTFIAPGAGGGLVAEAGALSTIDLVQSGTIIGGPEYIETEIYWQVRADDGQEGWMLEGYFDHFTDTLAPPIGTFSPGSIVFASLPNDAVDNQTYNLPNDDDISRGNFLFGDYDTIIGGPIENDGFRWWLLAPGGPAGWVKEEVMRNTMSYSVNTEVQLRTSVMAFSEFFRTADNPGNDQLLTSREVVTIIEPPVLSDKIWWHVRTADGFEGWVSETDLLPPTTLELIEPPSDPFAPGGVLYIVDAAGSPIRLLADDATQSFNLPSGTYITVMGESVQVEGQTWLPVRWGRQYVGWMQPETLQIKPTFNLNQDVFVGAAETTIVALPDEELAATSQIQTGTALNIINGPYLSVEGRVYWQAGEGWVRESDLSTQASEIAAVEPTAVPQIEAGVKTFKVGDVFFVDIPRGEVDVPLFLDIIPTPSDARVIYGQWGTITGAPQPMGESRWWPVDVGGLSGWLSESNMSQTPAYQIGDDAVVGEDTAYASLLSRPSMDADEVGRVISGGSAPVIDGPEFDDRQVYWKLRGLDGSEGWALEMMLNRYADKDPFAISFEPGSYVYTRLPEDNTAVLIYPRSPENPDPGSIPRGMYAKIISGPLNMNGETWWYLRTENQVGWVLASNLTTTPSYSPNQEVTIGARGAQIIGDPFEEYRPAAKADLGEVLTLVEGPRFHTVDGYFYWRVRTSVGVEGWLKESFLEPPAEFVVQPLIGSSDELILGNIVFFNIPNDDVDVRIAASLTSLSTFTYAAERGSYLRLIVGPEVIEGENWWKVDGNVSGWVRESGLRAMPWYRVGDYTAAGQYGVDLTVEPDMFTSKTTTSTLAFEVMEVIEGPHLGTNFTVYWRVRLASGQEGWVPETQLLSPDDAYKETQNSGVVISGIAPTMIPSPTLNASAVQIIPTTTAMATMPVTGACRVVATAPINLRSGPGTNFDAVGEINAGQTQLVTARETNPSGFIWYRLMNGFWVREDVIDTEGDCANIPPYDPESSAAETTSNQQTTTAAVTITRPTNYNSVRQLTSLWSFSKFRDRRAPNTQEYHMFISAGASYRFSFAWCADTPSRLREILTPLTVHLYVLGTELDSSQVLQSDTGKCYVWDTILSDMQAGETVLVELQYQLSVAIFDGTATYQPGAYIHKITLSVG